LLIEATRRQAEGVPFSVAEYGGLTGSSSASGRATPCLARDATMIINSVNPPKMITHKTMSILIASIILGRLLLGPASDSG
jgi:hypothetical protein